MLIKKLIETKRVKLENRCNVCFNIMTNKDNKTCSQCHEKYLLRGY